MAKRIGQYTIQFDNPSTIVAANTVVGKKEGEGPLGRYFDTIVEDEYFGQETFEKAESFMQTSALQGAIQKAGITPGEIHYVFAGDLLNQLVASSFGLREMHIPYMGLYSACSTVTQGMLMSGVYMDAGAAHTCAIVTSSHFCTAERQYRMPLEYGGQRTPTAQWTATASGGYILRRGGTGPLIRAATAGVITDLGIKDANNMGAAMAPAAADTIRHFLEDTGTSPHNYDLILTGDLGRVGSDLLYELLSRDKIDIQKQHNDCGLLLYDIERQQVNAGGSGCGCAASVFGAYILPHMQQGEFKNILFIATGALLSTLSSQQGESIPCIAHLVNIVRG